MKKLALFSLSLFLLISFLSCFKDDPLSAVTDDPLPVDGPPVTRSEAVLTADRYARVKWTMTEENRRGVTCGGNFVSQYQPGPRRGVGYKWGGWTDIDEFVEKIEAGYGTGTGGYVDYDHYPIDCVVGVSCTGLVSRAWNLDFKYTLCYTDPAIERKFCDICTEIEGVDISSYETAGIRKGDALINATHIVLFVYETRGRQPVIIESTGGGVRRMQTSWYTLYNGGYIPIRYNNIVEDPEPKGTIDHPTQLDLSLLPLETEGNTLDVYSMEFDLYSCGPVLRQRGPETIYSFVLESSRQLRFSINDLKTEGINNDLYLLSSLEIGEDRTATGCEEWGDSMLEGTLEAGTWYLVVDSGNDQPGEFILTVEDLAPSAQVDIRR